MLCHPMRLRAQKLGRGDWTALAGARPRRPPFPKSAGTAFLYSCERASERAHERGHLCALQTPTMIRRSLLTQCESVSKQVCFTPRANAVVTKQLNARPHRLYARSSSIPSPPAALA